MRRQNTAAVLQAVLGGAGVSRAEIAAGLGLSQGTVSKIITPILAAGVLEEGEPAGTGGGRPRIPLGIRAASRLAVGLHFGLQRTTVGLVDLLGNTHSTTVLNRRANRPVSLVAKAAEAIRKLVEASSVPILGVGATTGGWVDPSTGTVVANEPLGWQDVPLSDLLAAELDLPVLVESSVRAQAGAELWFGCAQQSRSTVHVFVGNVIDAAVSIDRVIHGGIRSAAGRIGHLPVVPDGPVCPCGRRGVLQAVAADSTVIGLARDAGVLAAGEGLTELAAKAVGGDGGADRLLRERARHVGTAVGYLVDLFDPDLVVLSGGVLAVPGHLDEVREVLAGQAREGWEPERVVATELGRNVLVNSSASVVLGAYFADPLRFDLFGEYE